MFTDDDDDRHRPRYHSIFISIYLSNIHREKEHTDNLFKHPIAEQNQTYMHYMVKHGKFEMTIFFSYNDGRKICTIWK